MAHAQVEPVRWPHARMRKVLNAAVTGGGVSDDMIAAAQQALDEGYQGSLSRCESHSPTQAIKSACMGQPCMICSSEVSACRHQYLWGTLTCGLLNGFRPTLRLAMATAWHCLPCTGIPLLIALVSECLGLLKEGGIPAGCAHPSILQ